MSYAEIASKGPKQSPEEAAAPQPPQVLNTDQSSTSTASSLVDVDTPSVRTVPSDFDAQDVKTDTQAARIDLEAEAKAEAEEAAARARAEADLEKKKRDKKHRKESSAAAAAGERVKRAEGWLVRHIESISQGGAAGAVAAVNLLAVVGLSGWLGYRAWGLYDRGRLGIREVGMGLGVLGVVGAVEGVFVSYLNKVKGKEQ